MLLIFNPDTDYALASGLLYYTAPRPVAELSRSMAAFPALYARAGRDTILCLHPDWDRHSPWAETALRKGLPCIGLPKAVQALDHDPDGRVQPWGWNAALRQTLLSADIPSDKLPATDSLDALRRLSHRRLTVKVNDFLARHIPEADPAATPVELHAEQEAVDFWLSHSRLCWFKTPWSSSGRGVMCTRDLEERHIRPWARGMIARQGSIMGEAHAERTLDFATEWVCRGGKVHFAGLSVFETSRRGKYKGNLTDSQDRLRETIVRALPSFGPEVLQAQAEALGRWVAPDYDGPLGIDMMALADGTVRPCVEINLRLTMGFTALPHPLELL